MVLIFLYQWALINSWRWVTHLHPSTRNNGRHSSQQLSNRNTSTLMPNLSEITPKLINTLITVWLMWLLSLIQRERESMEECLFFLTKENIILELQWILQESSLSLAVILTINNNFLNGQCNIWLSCLQYKFWFLCPFWEASWVKENCTFQWIGFLFLWTYIWLILDW